MMMKAPGRGVKKTSPTRRTRDGVTRPPSARERTKAAGSCCADAADWHAELFRLLADPNRLRIIYRLLEGPMNVGEIAASVGIEQSLVSHHLATLRKRDLVVATRAGRLVRYQLPREVAVALDGKTLDLGCCVVTFRRATTEGRPPRGSSGSSPRSRPSRGPREAD